MKFTSGLNNNIHKFTDMCVICGISLSQKLQLKRLEVFAAGLDGVLVELEPPACWLLASLRLGGGREGSQV